MAATPRPAHTRRMPDALLERLLVFLVATSLLGVALGWLGAFSAPLLLLGALAITLAYARWTRTDPGGLPWAQVVPVLLLALALRAEPYDYVLGGQDQGVYTNMAAELVHSRDLRVVDAELARISARGHRPGYLRDNYTVPFLPGVYTDDAEPPGLQFQFYHVFPVWLALAGGLFGMSAAGFALTFLSLVSVLFFQRLAAWLTDSERIGMVAGVLLALNPLHALFSRFPLTEVPTLAFSTAGFAFLVRYARTPLDARQGRWLALSACAFLALFLTRISGFMYLPLVGLVSLVALLCDVDRARARALSLWACAVVVAYALSVAYGLVWSRPYAQDIYEASFGMLAGKHWPVAVGAACALGLLGWALAWRHAEREPLRAFGRALAWARPGLGVAMGVILLAGSWKAWQLGFSPRFLGDRWLSQFPGVAGAGWTSVAHASLVVAGTYLSPLLLIAMPWLAGRRLPAAGSLLAFFVACFLAYAAFLNWTVPYQPYYARYLCSELVPYGLLLGACSLAWLPRPASRTLLASVLALAAASSAWLSVRQLDVRENEGARESIARLAAIADDGDVILLDTVGSADFHPKEVKTALVYAFGRHVVSIGDAGLGDPGYLQALSDEYDDVFLATQDRQAPKGFERVDAFRLRAYGFERGGGPPDGRRVTLDANLRVFRLAGVDFPPGAQLRFSAGEDLRLQHQVGRRTPELGLVADGRAGFLLYGPYASLGEGRYQLEIEGQLPAGEPAPFVDVVTGGGARRLGLGEATGLSRGVVVRADFEVPAGGVADLEVRARVAAGARLVVSGYGIRRVR